MKTLKHFITKKGSIMNPYVNVRTSEPVENFYNNLLEFI